ncbi:Dual specificity phosphatase ibp1 [Leucoagaricus sp. SymC.cos]|nr:Dual specificity phosphatase ibp1 [Leucoagaricus sp. SymC.cos]
MTVLSSFSFMITVKNCHDIRCSAYTTPTEIVVGAKQYAVYLMDIFNYPQTRILKTHSDVLSITRTRDLVYAGTRNGSIHRFDLRVPDSNGTKNIFSNKYQTRSTVLYMQLINDIQFLTSYMNGDLLLYDIRYTRNTTPVLQFQGHVNTHTSRLLLLYDIRYTRNTTPVLQFQGHVNTHTSRLGIAIDPTSEFLFAAGQDRKVRGWSIRTGSLLLPPSPSSTFNTLSNRLPSDHSRNPFLMEFENPIETLQVTREPHLTFSQDEYGSYEDLGGGMRLWAVNDCQELAEKMKDPNLTPGKDFIVIDVRDYDRAGGHIVGSVNKPSADFLMSVDELVKDTKDVPLVIFHCALSQMRGPKAARIFEETRSIKYEGQEITQEVAILRDGFVGFQDKYRHDPKLVEQWDQELWEPNVIPLPENLDDFLLRQNASTKPGPTSS